MLDKTKSKKLRKEKLRQMEVTTKYKVIAFGMICILLACTQRISNVSSTDSILKGKSDQMKGVWLTNVASKALNSKENIVETVRRCDSLGFNNIFVVTWNDAHTIYPSKVMKNLTGVEIDTVFAGRDPLKELIEEAHKVGIKVHAWFEFGFSCSYKQEDGGMLIKLKPNWAAKDVDGKLVSKNGFQWMNAFDPEVQRFVSSLIMEVVENYNIDGIQGDDRLPALPSSGGYDDYTTKLYQSEHSGRMPPKYEKDYDWVKWRSGKLTNYLKGLYTEVKKAKPNVIVSMAPSIYPWCELEYLQDWPTWVNMGIVDMVIPQVYRYKHSSYEYELKKIVTQQVAPQYHSKLFPGILLQVDDYNPSLGMLDSMIQTNRNFGLNGEVHFFYEGIGKYKDYFRRIYK